MNFSITKNTLLNDNMMNTLTVENEEYKAHFFYLGDYKADKENKRIDLGYLSFSPKPKKDNLDMIRYEEHIYIKMSYLTAVYLDDDKIADLKRRLDIANEARHALLDYMNEYFLQYTTKGGNET